MEGNCPLFKALQLLVGQDLLIIEASRSNSDTPHPVGLLWTRDQLDAETSIKQHTTFTRDIHALGGIRTHNTSKRSAADPRLKPLGHWDYITRSSITSTFTGEKFMVMVTAIKFMGSKIYMKKFRTQKQTTKLHYLLLNEANELG
jgi:hypothetical protein